VSGALFLTSCEHREGHEQIKTLCSAPHFRELMQSNHNRQIGKLRHEEAEHLVGPCPGAQEQALGSRAQVG
jgi:hypothetical protein